MCQREDKNHVRHIQDPAGHYGGDEQGSGCDGGNFVAAKDVGLAFLDGANACSHQPIAQDADDEHHGDHHRDGRTALSVHCLGENKKENEWEKIVEENDGAIAQSQLEVDGNQGLVTFHWRRLFPVISINTSSRLGCLRRTSVSSSPCWSTHFTRSTSVAAGRRER